MARKSKVGLDYFPHDCTYDDELKYIIALHKETGYYVYFELLKKIYNGFGYYCIADKKVLTLFANEINVDIITLNVIINDCLSEHLFDKNIHHKHKILTSKGIQERYFRAIERRREVHIINDYILIDYVNILSDDVNILSDNTYRNRQSKVKYSKVEESKGDTTVNDRKHPLQTHVKDVYKNVTKMQYQLTEKECIRLVTDYNKEDIKEILEAMENKKDLAKKNLSVNLTIRNWMKFRNNGKKVMEFK